MCSSAMALPPSSQIAALIRGVASHKQVFINNRDRSGQTKRLSAANNDLTRQRFNRLTVQRSTKLIAQCVSEGKRKTVWPAFVCAKRPRLISQGRASTAGKTGRSRQEQAVDKTPHQNASCSLA